MRYRGLLPLILIILTAFQLVGQVFEVPMYPTRNKKVRKSSVNFQLAPSLPPQTLEVQMVDSLVIFGGDMILGRESEFFGTATSVVATSDDHLWPDGIIPYVKPSANHPCQQAIMNAIAKYNKETNVCFVEWTNQQEYVVFGAGNCNSVVGYHPGYPIHIVNVSKFCGCERGAIHELGHVIGLFHEHQSKYRNNYIKVLEGNIPKDFLDLAMRIDGTPKTGYDRYSVMHYPPRVMIDGQEVEIFKCIGEPCPAEMGQRQRLSPGDIMGINILYPKKMPNCENRPNVSLFLFDLSGSMNAPGSSGQPKILEAKNAAIATLLSLEGHQPDNAEQWVAIKGFSGDCVADPTRMIQNVTNDLTAAKMAVYNIPPPNGGTPLPQAIAVTEAQLRKYLIDNKLKQGKLIVLSDGESTCGPIRPEDVYAFGQSGMVTKPVAGTLANPAVRYYTVGFNIPPGSAAERDLQFLAKSTGGKYLGAQNEAELTRAFQKFNRVYVPKPAPAGTVAAAEARNWFAQGVTAINDEDFEQALERCRQFAQTNPQDCHGAYNLALACEATEYFKTAIDQYQRYLQLCPVAADRAFVEQQIKVLSEDYRRQLAFYKATVQSDMAYLDLHFKQIQNGQSVALAREFTGFIAEKYSFYETLAARLEIDNRAFKTDAAEVFRGLKQCKDAIKRNPETWDRDATPALSRTYFNMERLLQSF